MANLYRRALEYPNVVLTGFRFIGHNFKLFSLLILAMLCIIAGIDALGHLLGLNLDLSAAVHAQNQVNQATQAAVNAGGTAAQAAAEAAREQAEAAATSATMAAFLSQLTLPKISFFLFKNAVDILTFVFVTVVIKLVFSLVKEEQQPTSASPEATPTKAEVVDFVGSGRHFNDLKSFKLNLPVSLVLGRVFDVFFSKPMLQLTLRAIGYILAVVVILSALIVVSGSLISTLSAGAVVTISFLLNIFMLSLQALIVVFVVFGKKGFGGYWRDFRGVIKYFGSQYFNFTILITLSLVVAPTLTILLIAALPVVVVEAIGLLLTKFVTALFLYLYLFPAFFLTYFYYKVVQQDDNSGLGF